MYFIVAVRAVLPVFLLIAAGFLFRRAHLLSDGTVNQCNTLAFRFFLPCQIFQNVFEADLSAGFSLRLAVFTAAGVLLVFLLSLLVGRTEPRPEKRGVLEQGIFRGNFVLLGIPILSSLFGADNLGPLPLMVAIVVPMFNILSIMVLEKNDPTAPPRSVGQLLLDMLKNPLIIGSVLGLLAKLTDLPLYRSVVFRSTLGYLAQLATPLTLLMLGAALRPASIRDNRRQVLLSLTGKLILAPMLALFAGAALGFRGPELGLLLVVFATPTAANSYIMAVQCGGDSDLAANLVVYSTACSCVTLFFWIVLLQQLAWL